MGNLIAIALAASLSLTLAAGCSGAAMTTTPDLQVDDAFTDAEFAEVVAGAAYWEPQVRFTVSRVSHDAARSLEGDGNTVHVYRSSSFASDAYDCPNRDPHNEGGNHFDGITSFSAHRGTATVCLLPTVRREIAAHELGHAVGLKHDDESSALMFWAVTSGQPAPTCRDWGQLSGVLGTALPEACK